MSPDRFAGKPAHTIGAAGADSQWWKCGRYRHVAATSRVISAEPATCLVQSSSPVGQRGRGRLDETLKDRVFVVERSQDPSSPGLAEGGRNNSPSMSARSASCDAGRAGRRGSP